MEEMSPAVALTLSLGTPIRESSGINNSMEITRLKLVTDAANLLSDSPSALHSDSNPSRNGDCNGLKVEANSVSLDGEDDEILSVNEDANHITGEELLPLDAASENSLPIAVEIEGINNGQLVAKVISLEERSFDRKKVDDQLTVNFLAHKA